jgi:hypothetical protein
LGFAKITKYWISTVRRCGEVGKRHHATLESNTENPKGFRIVRAVAKYSEIALMLLDMDRSPWKSKFKVEIATPE